MSVTVSTYGRMCASVFLNMYQCVSRVFLKHMFITIFNVFMNVYVCNYMLVSVRCNIYIYIYRKHLSNVFMLV